LQALEEQKMTLSTLRSMNVQMDDLAGIFTRQAQAMQAPAAAAKAPAGAKTARKPAARKQAR
jgi:hypothetical protein